MKTGDLLREVQARDAFVWADGDRLELDMPDDFPERLVKALAALMNNPLADANPSELMQKLDVGAAMNGHLRTC